MAALDEAGADLRGDQALAVEDADGVAAKPNQQRRHNMVGRQRVEQRLQPYDVVLALVRKTERRPDDNRLAGSLDSCLTLGVVRPPRLALERRQALADVRATDEAGHRGTIGRGKKKGRPVGRPSHLRFPSDSAAQAAGWRYLMLRRRLRSGMPLKGDIRPIQKEAGPAASPGVACDAGMEAMAGFAVMAV